MAKVSKASVDYRPADLPDVRCGTCVMYSAHTCTLVQGSIDPQHVCDRWQPRRRLTSGHARENTAATVAAAVALVWVAAEMAILAAIAYWVARVLTGGLLANLGWRRLRQTVTLILHQAQLDTRALLRGVAADIRRDAERVIREDLAGRPGIPISVVGRAVAESLSGPAAAEWRNLPVLLHAAGLNVSRSVDDIYRQVVAEAMAAPGDRLDAAQRALDEFAEHGITGYTDTLGRRWDIAAYIEMAVRTAASRMHLALQLAATRAAGLDLVLIVHTGDTPPCPNCTPYVGQVLSLGELAQAQVEGLFHPSCRCSAVPWSEGMDRPASATLPPDVAGLYEAEQAQRRHERSLRRVKRLRAAAVTPRVRRKTSRLDAGIFH